MSRDDHAAEPTVAEIAALTARFRDLSPRGALASEGERAAFIADKDALLARIIDQHRVLDDEGPAIRHEHSVLTNRLTALQGTPGADPFDRGSPPMSAEDAAQDLAVDGIPLDQARATVRNYQDAVSDQVGCSVHLWGLDAADLADLRQTSSGHGDGEAERREQIARWHADDHTAAHVDEHILDREHDDGTAS